MNRELVRQLSVITEEEKEILKGKREVDRSWYAKHAPMVIDSKKMRDAGKLIQLCPHTRFVHFPKHRHNYIEIIYMCQGQTIHKVDGTKIILDEGELLFLNQEAEQEILPAGESDLAIRFILLPEFFEKAFRMPGEEEHLIRDFLIRCLLTQQPERNYLYFQVADVLPVQNLIENMIWTLLNGHPSSQTTNRLTMELLFMQLANCTEKLEQNSQSFEQNLILQVLRYIDRNYRDGQLSQLSSLLGYDIYWLSRMIKRLTGQNYKDLLQIKRLNQAAYLLLNTKVAISDISIAVGYDNTSYFHRIFREYYKMSPKEYRLAKKSLC